MSNERVQFFGTFINIARMHWATAQTNKEKLPSLLNKLSQLTGDDADYFNHIEVDPIEDLIDHHCMIIIVSCAFALEGYINDYAGRNLSDSFIEDIDKLDLVSKWIIIPQLVTGKKFPKDGRAYQLLKQLVSDRNFLAHPKSTSLFVYDEKAKKLVVSPKLIRMHEFHQSLFEKAQNAINALNELSLVMENLDPEEYTSFHLDEMVGRSKQHLDDYGI